MSDPEAGRFLALSVALTGFEAAELRETGLAEAHRALTARRADPARYGRLAGAADPYGLIERDEGVRELARSICHLWYAGVWPGPSPEAPAPAPAEGLVWRSFGGEPPGAGRPGPGSWARPPADPAPGGRS
ncbi:hypothetical protein GCM10010232_53910 [Streptomyces amakusaensis]|uniref:Uncharacterized protein n=1 Tax=Streptomyces amakusaensis TaxID=67271 RepID=A0ABW0APG4_9ACTN